jgi:arsenate reductase
MNEAQAIKALAALAQGTRLAIFRRLVVAGLDGMRPGELAEGLNVLPSSLSFHLKELLHAGLIDQEREGKNLIYRAHLPHMNALLAYLSDNCCGGQPCLNIESFACTVPNLESAMNEKTFHVLFLCTANSARSIMAEACLNRLGGPRMRAFSAGSHPSGDVHPMALSLLTRHHYDTAGLRSKSWQEYTLPQAPVMDFVFTVCDRAAAEPCPTWPGQPISAHWAVADPVQVAGSPEQMAKAFADAFVVLHRRISLLLALPLDKLDRLSLKTEVDRIALD